MMPGYFAASTLVVLPAIVMTRVVLLRRTGTQAMHFGKLDTTDFLIPPAALFYFYTVFAAAFGWPIVSRQRFFHSNIAAWAGVALCLGGLFVLVASLVSFGRSFRVGIYVDQPDELVTTGLFLVSRNPIYVGGALILIGEFFAFPTGYPWPTSPAGSRCFTARYCVKRSSCATITVRNTLSTASA